MTYGSLFSGCGGGDLGLDAAGLECRWQVEIDPTCQSILRRHWPSTLKYPDIIAFVKLLKYYKKTNNHAALRQFFVDLISGGSPCQDLSVAGKRAGLDGQRSGLFRPMVCVCRILQPEFILWENVAGVLSSNGGRDFARVIGYFTGVIPSAPPQGWGNAGFFKAIPGLWNLAYRVLDSQYFGVPQRRRRVFVVGSLGTERCLEILFEPESLHRNPAPRREAGKEVAGSLGGGAGTRGWCNDLDRSGAFITGTLTASGRAAGSATQQDAASGLLIPFYQAGSTPALGIGTLKASMGRSLHTGGCP